MAYKILDSNLNNELMESAIKSERLRYHLNLHGSYNEPVQRIIIALIRGTYIPPHYHVLTHQWECFNVISGDVSVLIFDRDGNVINKIVLGQQTGVYGIEFPPGTIHTLFCNSENSIIMELKEGPFNPDGAKIMLPWSPDEHYKIYSREHIINVLEHIESGEHFPTLLSAR